ncbi:MAG TPA: branched-chain amino acid aminotransferase [Bacteroidia bacterium]|jgi:branched-chain amino acid aminotransferase|nr:branched-chain amino acid aminotransferase [Bacteroidia bacterium]
MIATPTLNITINKAAKSRIKDQDINHVPFGKIFTDHMFVAEYENGKWTKCSIEPYGSISMSYATCALHYGQTIFEGMKAFRTETNEINLFRPYENFKRLNKSAERMAMPEVPEDIFMGGLIELLKLDKEWVPTDEYGSLYIRPFIIATEEAIGVRPSDTYKFIIIMAPAGKYYSEPLKVIVERSYFRAVEGGVGFVKVGGNYGRSLYPTKLAQQKGYQQVIWTDSKTHQYVEESGTMNLMFVIGDTVVTPALSDTILAGITRDTVLNMAKHWGMKVEERKVSIPEILEAHKNGQLKEAFGTGTAATIAQIVTIGCDGTDYQLPPVSERRFSTRVDDTLRAIRQSRIADEFGWIEKVC